MKAKVLSLPCMAGLLLIPDAHALTFQFDPEVVDLSGILGDVAGTFHLTVELTPNADTDIYTIAGFGYESSAVRFNWIDDYAGFVVIASAPPPDSNEAYLQAGTWIGDPLMDLKKDHRIRVEANATYTVKFIVDALAQTYTLEVTLPDGSVSNLAPKDTDFPFYQQPPFIRYYAYVDNAYQEWENLAIASAPVVQVPLSNWKGYEVSLEGMVDTEDFMGVLNVLLDTWIWSYKLESYIYLPPSETLSPGAWVYLPKE